MTRRPRDRRYLYAALVCLALSLALLSRLT